MDTLDELPLRISIKNCESNFYKHTAFPLFHIVHKVKLGKKNGVTDWPTQIDRNQIASLKLSRSSCSKIVLTEFSPKGPIRTRFPPHPPPPKIDNISPVSYNKLGKQALRPTASNRSNLNFIDPTKTIAFPPVSYNELRCDRLVQIDVNQIEILNCIDRVTRIILLTELPLNLGPKDSITLDSTWPAPPPPKKKRTTFPPVSYDKIATNVMIGWPTQPTEAELRHLEKPHRPNSPLKAPIKTLAPHPPTPPTRKTRTAFAVYIKKLPENVLIGSPSQINRTNRNTQKSDRSNCIKEIFRSIFSKFLMTKLSLQDYLNPWAHARTWTAVPLFYINNLATQFCDQWECLLII